MKVSANNSGAALRGITVICERRGKWAHIREELEPGGRQHGGVSAEAPLHVSDMLTITHLQYRNNPE